MINTIRWLPLMFVALLAGCAASPESISPSYVSPVTFDSYSCNQLAQEVARVESALANASKQQEAARTGDTVGILLLGLPTASMSGQNVAPEVARLKGQKEAIQQTQILKKC